VDNKSYIDERASACLCDVGLPGYVAAVLVAADGRQDLVLVDEELIGDERHAYNRTTPEAVHEQLGELPLAIVRRITISSRVHRCGRPTKTTGRPCRIEVSHRGEPCGLHRRQAALDLLADQLGAKPIDSDGDNP
jgi:hypothetical protein